MVPKIPSCHYMLLMQPSRLKFISNKFHVLCTCKMPHVLPPGNNSISVNNNNNNKFLVPFFLFFLQCYFPFVVTFHLIAPFVVSVCVFLSSHIPLFFIPFLFLFLFLFLSFFLSFFLSSLFCLCFAEIKASFDTNHYTNSATQF